MRTNAKRAKNISTIHLDDVKVQMLLLYVYLNAYVALLYCEHTLIHLPYTDRC